MNSDAIEKMPFKGVFKEWRYHKVLYIVDEKTDRCTHSSFSSLTLSRFAFFTGTSSKLPSATFMIMKITWE